MEIDPGSPVPRWRQLADILRGQIGDGELTGRIPGEKHLMQQYGLALGTVRKALALLRDEGLITTTPGLGSFATGSGAGAPDSEPPRHPAARGDGPAGDH